MNKSKQKSKTSWLSDYYGFLGLHKHIVKVAVLLLPLSVLPLLTACSTTETNEPTWNDMYEVRSYQVETITNEIITTVFICRQTETNKLVSVEKEEVDFGGYEFEPIGKDINVPTNGIELQCVDGSCGIEEK